MTTLDLSALAKGQPVTVDADGNACAASCAPATTTRIESLPTAPGTILNPDNIGSDNCEEVVLNVKNNGDTPVQWTLGVLGVSGRYALFPNEGTGASDTLTMIDKSYPLGFQTRVPGTQYFNQGLEWFGKAILCNIRMSGATGAQQNQNLIKRKLNRDPQDSCKSRRVAPQCPACPNNGSTTTDVRDYSGVFPVGGRQMLEMTILPGQDLEFILTVCAQQTSGIYESC